LVIIIVALKLEYIHVMIQVVREFKRRKEEIERLETQLANKEQERDSHQV
jgi:hypothetical protein